MINISPLLVGMVEQQGECIVMVKNIRRDGYSRVTISHKRRVLAHRHSWAYANEVAIDNIPEGMWVLHSCDNPPCVNPNHLRIGTPKENNEDMMSRGRQVPQTKVLCKRGHNIKENSYINPSDGFERCKVCKVETSRLRHLKKKGSQINKVEGVRL